ncbi:MAG: hypothetical protein K2N60_05015 [Oscillospiraceae bacterium]|nr:hypothetical protein [Oscillospiraceae bacterium]
MDKMKETIKIISMLTAMFFMLWVCGADINFIPYISADPSLPYAITVRGKTISLISGEGNLSNALNGNYGRISKTAWDYCGPGTLVSCNYGNYIKYHLDWFGSDQSSVYNGITTASTKEELEAAFGTDCIKTDDYYAEIFINDKEVDYNSIDYPEDFEDYDFSFDEWFETTAENYPNAEYITILICDYYSYDFPNDITFYIYKTNINTEEI